MTRHQSHLRRWGRWPALAGPSASLALCASFLVGVYSCAAHAQTRTWTASGAGGVDGFTTPTNWSGGVAPNGIGHAAVISTKPSSSGDFYLRGGMTLGTLNYANSGQRSLFSGNDDGFLNFQRSSGNAQFLATGAGKLDIALSGISLNSTTEFYLLDWSNSMSISSPVNGSGGLVKSGDSYLVLENPNNSYTGLNRIAEGFLEGDKIANSGVNSSFGRGNFSIEYGGSLFYNGPSASTNRTVSMSDTGQFTSQIGEIYVAIPGTTLTLTGVVSGSGGLAKDGDGTLRLNASNTYSQETSIAAGTLLLGNNNRIPNGTRMIIMGTGTFNLNNFSETIGSLEGALKVILGSGTLTTGGNGLSTTYSGVISGSGSLVKNGAGTFRLLGNNTHSGLNTIAGGVLRGSTIANNGANSNFGRGNFSIANGAALQYDGSNASTNRTIAVGSGGGQVSVTSSGSTLTWSGAISGAGGLTKTGAGVLALSASNSYGGTTAITEGTLSGNSIADAGANSAFGRGNFTISDDAVLRYTGSSASTNRTIVLGIGGGQISVTNAATALTVSGAVDGGGNLAKTGAGALTLTADNPFLGNTSVLQGELGVSGALASIGQSLQVDVHSSATLRRTGGDLSNSQWLEVHAGGQAIVAPGFALVNTGTIVNNGTIVADTFSNQNELLGSGTFVGDVTSAGRLAPGSSPGELVISGSLTNTGTIEFQIDGPEVSDFDRIVADDVFAGGVFKFILGYTPSANDAFDVLDFNAFVDQGYSLDFSEAVLDGGLVWDTSALQNTGVIRVANFSAPSPIAIIDFENLPTAAPGTGGMALAEPVASGGFEFSSAAGTLQSMGPGAGSVLSDNGTTSLAMNANVPAEIDMVHAEGSSFDFLSFDAAEMFVGLPAFQGANAMQILVTGALAGGGDVSALFTLDGVSDGPGGVDDFEHFTLPGVFKNLVSVSFAGLGVGGQNDFQIDNLEVATVPEPASLLLAALAVPGYCMRKRRKRLSATTTKLS